MIGYARPTPPDRYAQDRALRSGRRAVLKAIAEGKAPDFDAHARAWRSYKRHLLPAQEGKCAFCDVRILGRQPGQVEHFAPKAAVHALDKPGVEDPSDGRATGRKTTPLSDRGYWWLAFEWENWLVACERCNVAWKRNLFPVQAPAGARILPPSPLAGERPLLLNPFDAHPVEDGHIAYLSSGQIQGETAEGKQTTQALGLERASLTQDRAPVYQDTLELIDDYRRCMSALHSATRTADQARIRKEARKKLQRLAEKACPNREFAGVARFVVMKTLGLRFDDLRPYLPATSPYR